MAQSIVNQKNALWIHVVGVGIVVFINIADGFVTALGFIGISGVSLSISVAFLSLAGTIAIYAPICMAIHELDTKPTDGHFQCRNHEDDAGKHF